MEKTENKESAPVKEYTDEEKAAMREEAITKLLAHLNSLPKGERAAKGRKARKYLRKLGFYLSKQEKETKVEEMVEA